MPWIVRRDIPCYFFGNLLCCPISQQNVNLGKSESPEGTQNDLQMTSKEISLNEAHSHLHEELNN